MRMRNPFKVIKDIFMYKSGSATGGLLVQNPSQHTTLTNITTTNNSNSLLGGIFGGAFSGGLGGGSSQSIHNNKLNIGQLQGIVNSQNLTNNWTTAGQLIQYSGNSIVGTISYELKHVPTEALEEELAKRKVAQVQETFDNDLKAILDE